MSWSPYTTYIANGIVFIFSHPPPCETLEISEVKRSSPMWPWPMRMVGRRRHTRWSWLCLFHVLNVYQNKICTITQWSWLEESLTDSGRCKDFWQILIWRPCANIEGFMTLFCFSWRQYLTFERRCQYVPKNLQKLLKKWGGGLGQNIVWNNSQKL